MWEFAAEFVAEGDGEVGPSGMPLYAPVQFIQARGEHELLDVAPPSPDQTSFRTECRSGAR